MTTQQAVEKSIRTALDSLKSESMLPASFEFDDETILLGQDSALDSIAFVGFLTAVEDSLTEYCGRNVYVLVDEIPDVNIDNPTLTVSSFRSHLTRLVDAH